MAKAGDFFQRLKPGRKVASPLDVLRASPLFDAAWYRETNPDLRGKPIDAAKHYLEHGAAEGRNPSPLFDTKYYLQQNHDVAAQEINPLVHYILHGEKEGRSPRQTSSAGVSSAAHHLNTSDPTRVLFISGDSKSPSHVYRIDNMMRGLHALGWKSEWVSLHEFAPLISEMANFYAVIFWRIAIGPRFNWSGELERAIRECEIHGVAVFFDVDDLVFDPELSSDVRFVDGVRYLTSRQLSQHREGVQGYHDLMVRCRNVLVPTEALKEQAERFGVRAFVVPNGLHDVYEAALHRSLAPPRRNKIVIGYAAGSRTHQKDFAGAAPALHRLLDARPNVELRIIGPVDLSEFSALNVLVGSRVFTEEAGPMSKLFAFLQQIDINLAPLELNNPYTASKSELKYFEAAVFGVPTVATRVGPYREIVRNGENGYAVETDAEWFAALAALVDDAELRRRVGAAAQAHVKANYVAPVIARKMLDAFEHVGENQKTAAPATHNPPAPHPDEVWPDVHDYNAERPLTINWFVPGLIIGGGGHRSILRIVYHLSLFGHRLRLYFTDTDQPAWKLRELVREHFYPLECPVYVYDGTMRSADVLFATYWSTVPIALRHRDVCPNVFYFVQDFEPAFFPMGSDYIMAENTYREGLYSICSRWCAHLLRTQYNGIAGSYIYPIKKEIYYPRPRAKQNLNIVFFAKPEMPRRCYTIGVEALNHVHATRPDVEIITFGSGHVKQDSLPFRATCKGILPTINDLAEMYSNADIGIVFSTTNPSLVPYEMLACGLPIVDIHRPGTEQNYDGGGDIALLANPLPTEMARQIVALLDDPAERKRRSRASINFMAQFPDENGMVRRIESLIVERLREVGANGAESTREHLALLR